MKRPTELIEAAKGFKSTDPIRVLAEYAVSLESPRKTVADAVDYFDGVWPDDDHTHIFYHPHSDSATEASNTFESANVDGYVDHSEALRIGDGMWYSVCTREEFEAEVERRNCTPCKFNGYNKVAFGGNCKVVCGPNAYGSHVIEMEDTGEWRIVLGDAISERKPTISKAEADAVKAYYAWMKGRFIVDPDEYLEQFDVK